MQSTALSRLTARNSTELSASVWRDHVGCVYPVSQVRIVDLIPDSGNQSTLFYVSCSVLLHRR